jgi:heterodisulfide reductase subunit C
MERESDIHPHQIIRMVQMGRKDEALHSKGIWLCISCQTCVSRCPMDVNTPAVIDALRAMATRKETPRLVRKVPIFNRVFLELTRRLGRVYELGMMGAFKLGSHDLFTDVEKFPMMLRKGKLRLIPTFPGKRAAVRRIFRAARKASG